MMPKGWLGLGTALVTPFKRDGGVDAKALRALVDWQIEEGVHFLVPCGSTGEAVTMSPAEHRRVVQIVVEQTAKRVPVCAGAGSNDTKKAVDLSRQMQEAGADMLLHVSPMYNKPPQRGLLAHFRAIADATELPIIVYNVPGRTASNIEAKTTLALAEHERIVAVKEASGNLAQIMEIIRDAPGGFQVLSGDDALTLPVMTAGGTGVVSVVSNMAPGPMARLVEACAAKKLDEARKHHERLLPLMNAAFVESNPIPAKAAMAMLGRMENVLRLPLVPMDAKHEPTLRAALEQAGAA
ncbi:MAG TPA: 4-hydroxy-tetrahydrodipicolinate synthase [Gemmatimonadaceae bacterium]|nr:4-hydroxy-tetrahydrodipicolinate synthase [Gemmatimonadaceae bacterium]